MKSIANRSDIPFVLVLPLVWLHEFSLLMPLFSFSEVQVLKACIMYKKSIVKELHHLVNTHTHTDIERAGNNDNVETCFLWPSCELHLQSKICKLTLHITDFRIVLFNVSGNNIEKDKDTRFYIRYYSKEKGMKIIISNK